MSAPTGTFANRPVIDGTGPAGTLTYTWGADPNALSFTVNLYKITPSASTIVATLTGTSLKTSTYLAASGAAYMFTVVAYSGSSGTGTPAQQVNSAPLLYAMESIGGPQGVQGNPGVQGLQGPAGPGGVQGPQGLQGIISINNWSTSNYLLTTSGDSGNINANNTLTFDGSTLRVGPNTSGNNITLTGGVLTTTNTNAHTLGPITFTNGAIAGATTIGASGAITAGSTSAHTLGPITFTNGAITGATTISNSGLHTTGTLTSGGTITAPSINNAAGTLTVTGAATAANHTLTVGAPTTASCNAINTAGTIYASGTNAHTLGLVTFTNGAIAGVTTVSNSSSAAITSIGESARPVGNIYATTFTGALSGNASGLSGTPNISVGTIGASGAITAGSTNAHTLGPITFSNGTINNGANTITFTAATGSNSNTLTVGQPTLGNGSAIYTTGKITAGSFLGNATSASTAYAGAAGSGTFNVSVSSAASNNTMTVAAGTDGCNAIYTAGTIGASGTITGWYNSLANLTVNTAGTTALLGFNASNQAGIYPRKGINNNYAGLDFVSWINTTSTTVMTISPNDARVGIGQTSPAYTLDVNGTIGASGAITASRFNGVLNLGNVFYANDWYSTTDGVNRLNFGSGYTYINGPSGIAFQIGNITMATLGTFFYANGGISTNGGISGTAVIGQGFTSATGITVANNQVLVNSNASASFPKVWPNTSYLISIVQLSSGNGQTQLFTYLPYQPGSTMFFYYKSVAIQQNGSGITLNLFNDGAINSYITCSTAGCYFNIIQFGPLS